MKREADGEMGSPQKRSRRGDEEVRLLIPSKAAGSIIGKAGQNITKLRSQYKASITVPDCPGPERVLTLSSDLETICNIINDIVPNLEQNGAKSDDGLDIRMLIHQSQAGCVIGRVGSKIKELRSSTGARIKIFTNCAPQSTDRIIQINGQDFQCINAISEIIKLIKTTPIKGPYSCYNPHNYDDYYADEYGGYGNGGDMRRGGSGATGPRSVHSGGRASGERFSSRGPPPPSRSVGPLGYDRSMSGPPPSRSSGYSNEPPRGLNGSGSYERPSGWGSPPPMNGGSASSMSASMPPSMMSSNVGSAMQNNGSSSQGTKSTTQVTIPKDLAGAIIGKGGSRIRKIRQESGAGITIDEPLPGSNDRIITITGVPNQIQMAQYLLQQSVHNNADQRNGGQY
ncbi:PREDICTED: heterogeneous nuclear ribonucleoprotein K isoform X2 [Nicrophorus vespilloides]|uniref:Heterogeneous nuclear ribonucleoprotein K isoform X2 n=1 Tax=Nicrophorus vespilloides TaxID=110193 RepID=A0ABM1MUC3_NICVS|nr:PREDICTED: heterogeneous nuclear ribonucleoprotein K isoform X2 [Nicrophorus vespilloides]